MGADGHPGCPRVASGATSESTGARPGRRACRNRRYTPQELETDEVAFRGNIVLYESIIMSPIGSAEDTTHIAAMERSVRTNSCPALDAIAEAGATHPDL